MAWTVGRTNPLILYPYPNLRNASFESVFTGGLDDWQTGGSAVRSSEQAKFGTYSLKNDTSGAAAASYAYQSTTLSNRFKSYAAELANGSAWYVYFWCKAQSHTGNAYITCRSTWQTAAYATISQVSTVYPIGTSTVGAYTGAVIAIDDTWRLYRTVTAIPTMPSNAAFMEILLGHLASEQSKFYIDGVSFCHALDGQDLNGVTNYGAMAVHPFRYGSTAAGSYGRGVAGKFHARRFHTGYKSGTLSLTPFSETDRATWNKFIDYAADGTEFSLNYSQTDTTRDTFDNCILAQDDDGLTQVEATPHWKGALEWREVP